MKKNIMLLSAVLILGIAVFVIASGANKYDLSLQLQEEQTYLLRTVNSMQMTQIFEGEKMEMTNTASVDYRFRVEEVAKGNYSLVLGYDNLDVEVSMLVPLAAEPVVQKMDDSFKKLLENASVQIDVSRKGDIIQLAGFAELGSRVTMEIYKMGLDPVVTQMNVNMLQEFLTEDMLKISWDSIFAYIPEKSVKVGQSWQNEYNLMEPFPYTVAINYTLQDATKEEMLIDVQADFVMNDVMQLQGADIDVKMNGQYTGQITIARSTGWIRTMNAEQTLTGTMETEVPGHGSIAIPVTLTVQSKITSD